MYWGEITYGLRQVRVRADVGNFAIVVRVGDSKRCGKKREALFDLSLSSNLHSTEEMSRTHSLPEQLKRACPCRAEAYLPNSLIVLALYDQRPIRARLRRVIVRYGSTVVRIRHGA